MYEVFVSYAQTAVQSDFFAGGLALGVLGAAVACLRLLWGTGRAMMMRQLCRTITIDNRTAAFRHFCVWLDDSGVLAHARRVQVTPVRRGSGREVVGPAPGCHWFWHEGCFCVLDRTLDEKARIGNGNTMKPLETISLTLFFGRAERALGWIEAGRQLCEAATARIGPGLHIFSASYWDGLGDVPRRPLATVLADDDRLERLAEDVRWFYGARTWYAERGVPWRRGYLLYGPPGTGKSSAIRAIASEVGIDIATLDIGRPGMGDDELREAMATAPKGSLIAVEDIDALFAGRETGEKRLGVSFSGLLNAIDGVAAQEGRALFMTTNHRERLDPALIRPGRADRHVELGPVGAAAAGRLFARFFPERSDLAERFVATLGARRLIPAAVQCWLLAHIDDPEGAARADGLIEETLLAAE